MAESLQHGLDRVRVEPPRPVGRGALDTGRGVLDSYRGAMDTGMRVSRVAREEFRGYLLSAAIDIGTCSSCYAFSYRSNPSEVRMNKNWSGQDNYLSYKTPTTILTEAGPQGKFIAFGYDAERKYREMLSEGQGAQYNLYTDFKMLLYREKKLSKKETMATSLTGTQRPLMDLYVMTLEYLRQHMLNEIDVTGASKVMSREMRWVLCVPATWHDKAKDFLRHAAYKAKLIDDVQSSQLVILLEATAAALYCKKPETRFTASQLHTTVGAMSVKPGAKYLVIDAGAGTVDYTAQQALADNRVKEITIANGGDWGGRHVDKRFTELLRQILGEPFISNFTQAHPIAWYDLEMSFESQKANVEAGKGMNIQLPTMIERYMRQEESKDISDVINSKTKEYGVKENNGYLVINKDRVKELFDPTIQKIGQQAFDMVESNPLQGLDIVYLVGGFAGCKLLQAHIKERCPDVKVSVPVDARAAVVQGAVIYGHNPDIITRVAKKTYGVSTFSDFKPERHSALKKTSVGRTNLCADLFLPFCHKGEELQPGTHGEMVASPIVPHAKSIVVDFYCLDRKKDPQEVLYIDSPGVQQHGSVRVDMPNTDDGLNREVTLYFTFNDEIRVVALDKNSATKKKVTLNFDYDVRK